MVEMTTVAVLMSTYNGDKYLQEQIESILAQNNLLKDERFNIDLWVRDDGSTDSTIDILRKYEASGKLYLIAGKNLRPAKSFISLLKECTGYDYYAFSDQDDCWNPDKLCRAISKMEETSVPTLYFSDAESVGANLRTLGRSVYKHKPKTDFYSLIVNSGVLGCTTVINSDLARLIQAEDLPNKIVMHDYFIASVCASVGGKIIYDPKSSMKYRQHEVNVVGVPHGFLSTIRNRAKVITDKRTVGIAEQALEILNSYGAYMTPEKKEWLERVGNYKHSPLTKLRLALSHKVKYPSFNKSITIRLAILCGSV